jgi:hypothetical protein
MLRRHNDASLEFVGDFQKPARHRRQLDRLGARAQDDRNLQGMDFIGSRIRSAVFSMAGITCAGR